MLLSACAMNNEQTGAITGAVVGGVVGNQIGGGTGKALATGIGIMAGAVIGGNVGKSMDRSDRIYYSRVLENTPTGQASSWRNPDTGNTYIVQPTRTYTQHGSPCREYNTTAIIGGQKENVYGTACRQADGSWKAQ